LRRQLAIEVYAVGRQIVSLWYWPGAGLNITVISRVPSTEYCSFATVPGLIPPPKPIDRSVSLDL
jgi:hypothetical protein